MKYILFFVFLFYPTLCCAADEVKQEVGIVQTLVKTSEYLPTLENVGGILGTSMIVGAPLYLSSFLSGCSLSSADISTVILLFTLVPTLMSMHYAGDRKKMLSTGALAFCCFLPLFLYTACSADALVTGLINGIPRAMGLN